MPFQPSYDVPPERRAFQIFGGEEVGCLMLHGFIGSPKSSHPMGAFLHQAGITCFGPLLPGHGEFPEKLHGVSRREWIAEAEDWLAQLRGHCREIFIIGHSMGGVLGAYLAHQYNDIRGLVLIAPPYVVPDRRLRLTWLLRRVTPWFHPWTRDSLKDLARQRVLDFDPTIDVDDPALQPWLIEATRFPMSALDEMRQMLALGRRLWPRLKLPVLLIQGGQDEATAPSTARRVFDKLTMPRKEMVFYPEAGHELMRPFSPFHREVWARIYEFIRAEARAELPETERLSTDKHEVGD